MITILVTGAGAPGTLGTFRMLNENRDNETVRIVATDMNEEVIGKYHANAFYRIHPCDNPNYIPELYRICETENVDVIIPQNTMELHKLSSYQWSSVKFMLDDANKIFMANNKISLIKMAASLGVSIPATIQFTYNADVDNLENAAKFFGLATGLGYGLDTPIVVKPAVGHGSRGVKILHGHIDYTERWMMKPDSLHMAAEDFLGWLDHIPTFTDMLIQEYLPGPEYTVDVMLTEDDGLAVVRKRDKITSGITSLGTVGKHSMLSDYCIRLSRKLGLEYPHGYQFKEDKNGMPKLLECNPRVQGTMIATHYAGWNIVWDGVRQALGQDVDLALARSGLMWNTRVLRFTDTISIE